MSFHMIIAVATGGALGSVARLLIQSSVNQFFGFSFPFGTIIINILGSLFLGVFLELVSHNYSISSEMKAFVVIGILGAFTTFSTFSFEFVTLWTRDEILLAYIYLLGSVFFGITAFVIGTIITKSLSQ